VLIDVNFKEHSSLVLLLLYLLNRIIFLDEVNLI
jgi:hypothetical protein